MSKTIGDITKRVLQKIGRLPDGQVAPASQTKVVEAAYDGLYQELWNDSLVTWAAIDDIPEFAVNPIIIILSGRVADDFGVPNQWAQREFGIMATLARQLASPYVPQPTQFEDL